MSLSIPLILFRKFHRLGCPAETSAEKEYYTNQPSGGHDLQLVSHSFTLTVKPQGSSDFASEKKEELVLAISIPAHLVARQAQTGQLYFTVDHHWLPTCNCLKIKQTVFNRYTYSLQQDFLELCPSNHLN